MILFSWSAGLGLALIWLSRVLDAVYGIPTMADISQPTWDRTPGPEGNQVTVVVPARNEQGSIRDALERLMAIDYEGYRIIAVNDRSSDQTGRIMDELAEVVSPKLSVIHLDQLPPGWVGKTHAMWTAARRASSDWLLFTDADVMFRRDCLRRALAYAEQERADHLVILPWIVMQGPGEKMMLAFFQLLFVFGHRPWKVADPKAKDHIGVGAFNLVRRSVYEAVGSFEALRFEVVDDMKLGKVIKNAGFRQRVVFGHKLIAIRWAQGARGVVNNLTKNFFAVMSFQTWRALLACLALGVLNLVPFLGTLFAPSWSRLPYAVALLLMFLLYVGIWRQGEIEPWYFLLHPISTLLFIYAMLRSMLVTLWSGGVEWRGTRYSLEKLRKGLV
ncbi:MAG: glycosyltransferase [Acidobacteria bacterium]|nr:glycosyltransferase [Acidobacteriota bacterium]